MQKKLISVELFTVIAVVIVLATAPLNAQGPISLNYVSMPEVYVANGESFAYPVFLHNAEPLDKAIVPIRFAPGADLKIDSISFIGSRFDNLGVMTTAIDNLNHKLHFSLDANPGTPIPTPQDTWQPIATLYLTVAQNAPTQDVVADSVEFGPGIFYSLENVPGDEVSNGFIAGLIHIVARRPVIHLDPDVFYFATTVGVNPPSQTLNITNLGVDPLDWKITSKPAWLNLSSMSGTAPSAVALMPDVGLLSIGSYFDSLAVTDSNAVTKTVWAYIHLEITELPSPNLAGTVEDPTSEPIDAAIVEIWDNFPAGSVLYSVTTGADGKFGFFDVPAGNYELYAYRDGYYPTRMDISAPDINILVTLVPTPDPNPTPQWINLYCDSSYLDGYLLPKGTVVEALDQSGTVCGQFFVHQVGRYGFMPVYRDDPGTPLDEGADSNEVLIMHINAGSADAFPTPVWTFNGDVQKVCLNTIIIETRCIPLHKGWNLVSWNVDTPDDGIETIVKDIKGCIDVVLGFEVGSATYDPDLPQFSTLDFVDHLHGYWFRMDCDTQLCVTGTKVEPRTPINLERNWNLVGYLPDDQDSTPHALSSVFDKLVVALGYDGGGQTYDPAHPELATLNVMKPEFGFWLKTTADATLIYPGPEASSGLYPVVHSTMKAYPPAAGITPTPEWVDLYGDGITVDGVLIPTGSTLAMYDEEGNLCGQALVQNGGRIAFTPVYREFRGAATNEGIKWGSKINLEVNGVPVQEASNFTQFGDRIRLGHLTSVVKVSESIPRDFELAQNFPNPFNPGTVIEFSLPVAGKATVEVINVLGVKVNTLVDRYLPAGKYSVTWNGTDSDGKSASSGVYFYRLTAGNFAQTKKMLLVK